MRVHKQRLLDEHSAQRVDQSLQRIRVGHSNGATVVAGPVGPPALHSFLNVLASIYDSLDAARELRIALTQSPHYEVQRFSGGVLVIRHAMGAMGAYGLSVQWPAFAGCQKRKPVAQGWATPSRAFLSGTRLAPRCAARRDRPQQAP